MQQLLFGFHSDHLHLLFDHIRCPWCNEAGEFSNRQLNRLPQLTSQGVVYIAVNQLPQLTSQRVLYRIGEEGQQKVPKCKACVKIWSGPSECPEKHRAKSVLSNLGPYINTCAFKKVIAGFPTRHSLIMASVECYVSHGLAPCEATSVYDYVAERSCKRCQKVSSNKCHIGNHNCV